MASAAERKTLPDFDTAVAQSAPRPAKAGDGASVSPVAAKLTSPATAWPAAPVPPGAGAARPAGAQSPACKPPWLVRAGDTLFSIAASHLGDGRLWPKIRDANDGIDPSRLRTGQMLLMPCSAQGRPATVATKTTKSDGSAKPVPAAAPAPVKPLPVWTAKQGEDFATVMKRWTKKAGHTLIIDTSDAWTLAVAVRLEGDFRTAVGDLLRGLAHDGAAPPVRIYPNKVVRIGL